MNYWALSDILTWMETAKCLKSFDLRRAVSVLAFSSLVVSMKYRKVLSILTPILYCLPLVWKRDTWLVGEPDSRRISAGITTFEGDIIVYIMVEQFVLALKQNTNQLVKQWDLQVFSLLLIRNGQGTCQVKLKDWHRLNDPRKILYLLG